MQSYTFSTEELYRDYEYNYIVNILRELVEKERKEVIPEYKNISDYKFVIGENVSKALHLSKTDHIFGFEVIYENSYVFEPNSVDFGIFKVDKKSCINCRYGVDVNSCCPYIHVCRKRRENDIPSHWLEMTEAQKLEKSMSNVNGKRKLVGDISNVQAGDICPVCGKPLKMTKGIEVGNTFKLGTKYSKLFISITI